MNIKRIKEIPGKTLRVGECVTVYLKSHQMELPIVTSSLVVKDFLFKNHYFTEFCINTREKFFCIYMSRSNQIIACEEISVGSEIGTVVDKKMIARSALLNKAQCAILVHNHPSGKLFPSNPDKTITKEIKQIFDMLEIKLLDHIIMSEDSIFSFADNGLI